MTEDDASPVAKVIRDLMNAAGLTQERMAAQLGVNVAVVARCLSGETTPSYQTLQKLVDVFGVDPRLLFRWKGGDEK